MKKGSPPKKFSKARMPPSPHSLGPSPVMSNMRSRSLSPLIGSDTLPFHPGEWYEQVEFTGKNSVLSDCQDHKGITFNLQICLTSHISRDENTELFLVQV